VNVKFECTPVARIWFNTELVEFLSCSQPVLCPQEHESFVVVLDCIVKHHVSNSNRVEFGVDNLEGFLGDCHNLSFSLVRNLRTLFLMLLYI